MSEKTQSEKDADYTAEIKQKMLINGEAVTSLSVTAILNKAAVEGWNDNKIDSAMLIKIAQFLEK